MTDQGRETRALLGLAEVTGPSMVPTLLHGDQLLVHYGAGLRPGDVAVLRHPLQQDLLIVKRLIERRDGGWWVLGDNTHAEGVDSRAFGTVPEELLLGRVRARYRPIMPGRQRSAAVVLSWLASAVRPVLADRDVSRRLRAR
ncbi:MULTISPECIES: nickel-type superoxide dismutase maturation protease [unclassified Streptomyces]|uniref:nickel-type superoxide dismutase maturation protease n=1 Tax=unclassified Streptomyces TaxID=2593676 RepID=UPI002E0EEB54|nr:nickel-type superoxide dismutase maturation protease [Streptomyces sp. NBC_01197]WSS51653.1 nickel-type superoxide dismutase maturation protease [Streptomyces sp. NBC_01180]